MDRLDGECTHETIEAMGTIERALALRAGGSLSSLFLSVPELFRGRFLYLFVGGGIVLAIWLLVVYVRSLRSPRKR